MKINTEFRKGVMFIRIKGCLCEKNLDNIKYEDFKYIVFNFDNLLSIDSYAISYIIELNNKIEKNNGKIFICDSKNSFFNRLFSGKIEIINNEIEAFNIM